MIKFKGYRKNLTDGFTSDTVVLFSTDNGETWANLPLCLQHVNHSPTGFNWGYYGSGPAQLAFAILFRFFRMEWKLSIETAERFCKVTGLYGQFKSAFIGRFGDEWEIDGSQIAFWLEDMGSTMSTLDKEEE